MTPALRHQDVAVHRAGAEGVFEAARQLARLAVLRVDRDQPAAGAAAHQIVDPVVARLLQRAVGYSKASVAQPADGIGGLERRVSRTLRDEAVERPALHPHVLAVQRNGDAAVGQRTQRSDGLVEACDLALAAGAHDARAGGDQDAVAVGSDIAGIVEFGDDLGVFQHLVGLQGTVEDRNGDRGLAAAQDPVAELAHRRDHADLPQRWSYWMKSGSAFASL